MQRVLSLICLCFLSVLAARASFHPGESQNLEELESLIRTEEKSIVKKLTCSWQLNNEKIPSACFAGESAEKTKLLNNFCLSWSHRVTSLSELDQHKSVSGISKFCGDAILARRKILIYQLVDENPESAFYSVD